MPAGTHWEWRGFGRITGEFQSAFEALPRKFEEGPEWDATEDEYVWIPECPINVKVRTGGQQEGLKFKRFVRSEGEVELWLENPEELYPFASFDGDLLKKLAAALGLSLRETTGSPLDREAILSEIRAATPQPSIVAVHKKRQTRVVSPTVQVELAEITNVVIDGAEVAIDRPLHSVAIENSRDMSSAAPSEVSAARGEILGLLASLNLRSGELEPMNYLQAVGKWVAKRPPAAPVR